MYYYCTVLYDVLIGTISSDETISLISDITNTNTITSSHSIKPPTSGVSSNYILTILNDGISSIYLPPYIYVTFVQKYNNSNL